MLCGWLFWTATKDTLFLLIGAAPTDQRKQEAGLVTLTEAGPALQKLKRKKRNHHPPEPPPLDLICLSISYNSSAYLFIDWLFSNILC